ncbi:hypothetical protein PG994_004385 [Apiospora phragmitis]|uniref:Uncharacterized protein n=1 Tax=Apiospora phragmitis TaxID=2905665 RepID=A0ABR1VQF8_9PEZI
MAPPSFTQPTGHTPRNGKTFEVEIEGSRCRIVVNDVLMPVSSTMKHSTDGDCHCDETDRAIIDSWMFWMADQCLEHGIMTEKQANAILNLTRKDLVSKARIEDNKEEGEGKNGTPTQYEMFLAAKELTRPDWEPEITEGEKAER